MRWLFTLKGYRIMRVKRRGVMMLAGFVAAWLVFGSLLAPAAFADKDVDGPQNGVLKVCADPNNLPFSNKEGKGFENKLATMIAAREHLSLRYEWYPEVRGGMPTPMINRDCDIIMGYAQGTPQIEDTNPYYYTSYVLIYRKDDAKLAGVTGLSDPQLRGTRIGIFTSTPPASLLVINGLGATAVPFTPDVDEGADAPTKRMIAKLADGKLDAVILWGPIGGYYAQRAATPLNVVPLVNETAGPAMVYGITMGVKPDQPRWKHQLNRFIAEDQAEIDTLLQSYGVPLLKSDGTVIKSASAEVTGEH